MQYFFLFLFKSFVSTSYESVYLFDGTVFLKFGTNFSFRILSKRSELILKIKQKATNFKKKKITKLQKINNFQRKLEQKYKSNLQKT